MLNVSSFVRLHASARLEAGQRSQAWENLEQEARDLLGGKVINVPDDGHCQFYSLQSALGMLFPTLPPPSVLVLRWIIQQELRDNRVRAPSL